MIAEGDYFYNAGGVDPMYVRYIIWRDDQFQLIMTRDEFHALFAPMASADEALSYALAMTNLSAYYGLERKSNYEYFVDMLEDTHVEQVADGYLIRLYDYPVFGCGPHITSAVDVKITIQGEVEQTSKKPVYKNPAEDGLCVD